MQADINGCNLNYQLSGKPGAPVVMLSHALASGTIMWDAQREVLEKKFHLLRYDTRGHGRSEATTGAYTLDMLGDDVIGLLDHLQLEKIHWVGLSMGGMIGQNLALFHADRLHSIALCDTTSRIPEEARPLWDERIELARTQGLAPLAEATLERWFTDACRRQAPAPYRQIRRQVLDTDAAGFIGCSEAIKELDYLDQLSAIDLPALILVGDDDLSTPPPNSDAMHVQITGSSLHVIPDARHLSNVEQPEIFNRLLLDFLIRLT